MVRPERNVAALMARRLPLVLAWGVVLFGLLSAVGYVLLAPSESPQRGTTEVRIALSDIPTLAEDAPAAEGTGAGVPMAQDGPSLAVSELPVIPEGDAADAPPEMETAAKPEVVPQIPSEPAGAVEETVDPLAARATPDPATEATVGKVERPMIAVVVSGLGLSDRATAAAIESLPPAVTLSFTPYGDNVKHWVTEARAKGHQVMMDLPMEPASFPNNDPGPRALITSLPQEENLARLTWILGRGNGIVGVTGVMGSRFSTSREQMSPILNALKERGLIFLDNRSTELSIASQLAAEIGLPRALNNRTIDENRASRVVIDARLAQIERVALTEGVAVAIAHPFPLTLERLAAWTESLDRRGFALVPITAVADRQPL